MTLTITLTNTRQDPAGRLDVAVVCEERDGRFHLHFHTTDKASHLLTIPPRAHLSLLPAVDDAINTLYAQPYLEYARRHEPARFPAPTS